MLTALQGEVPRSSRNFPKPSMTDTVIPVSAQEAGEEAHEMRPTWTAQQHRKIVSNKLIGQSVVVHAFNPSTGEAETDLCELGQSGLHGKSQAS